MKRILLLVVLLFLSPLSLMAESMEGDAGVAGDCRQNGMDIGLKDEDLEEYVAECVAANSDAEGMVKEEKAE
ncbi:MAG: hypothetical protein OEX83_07320 [Gammaproteobacteria bacterium]|nr:hypothetical protein [Gammaproteobacteria bacterium]